MPEVLPFLLAEVSTDVQIISIITIYVLIFFNDIKVNFLMVMVAYWSGA
jgi:hypothetical protein